MGALAPPYISSTSHATKQAWYSKIRVASALQQWGSCHKSMVWHHLYISNTTWIAFTSGCFRVATLNHSGMKPLLPWTQETWCQWQCKHQWQCCWLVRVAVVCVTRKAWRYSVVKGDNFLGHRKMLDTEKIVCNGCQILCLELCFVRADTT